MKNFLSSFALALVFFSVMIFAQINPVLRDSTPTRMPDEFIVGDVKGKIVNKPSFLPKPNYPLIAKQSGVEGVVRVSVKISDEGSVSEAKATEGPELLRSVCEETALRTRFVIARDAENKPISTEGHLTYTFEIRAANWIKIGYHLTFLELFSVAMAPLPTIIKAIPPDWKEEHEQLEKLKEIQQDDFIKYPPQPAPTPPRSIGTVGGIGQRSGSIVMQLPIPTVPLPTDEQVKIVQKLVPVLENRLKNDELNSWKFQVGLGIGKAIRLARNPAKRNDAVALLKVLQFSAPSNASPKVVAELERLSQLLQNNSDRDAINEAIIFILTGK